MDDSGIFGSGLSSAENSDSGLSRRQFISTVVVVGAAAGLASIGAETAAAGRALAASPPAGPPSVTVPLPTTTAPEQLLLTWGSDPASQVTVSFMAPGTVPMPAPALAFSRAPISRTNPGRLIRLPEPRPLDVARPYP